MPNLPLPPPIELPGPFVIPEIDYSQPQLKQIEWVPIPIYVKDIPKELNPKTSSKKPSEEQGETTNKRKKDRPKSKADLEESNNNNKLENPSKSTNEAISTPSIKKEDLSIDVPKSEFKEIQTVEVPFIGKIPAPKPEIIVTAVSTAGVASVASVGGTLAATALFKHIITLAKPLITFGLKKLAKVRGKKPPLTWARARAEQRRHKSGKNHSQI
jgi:hypothetical protein